MDVFILMGKLHDLLFQQVVVREHGVRDTGGEGRGEEDGGVPVGGGQRGLEQGLLVGRGVEELRGSGVGPCAEVAYSDDSDGLISWVVL